MATFIIQKILLDEYGLNYICMTAERFHAVSSVLSGMVARLAENPVVRLLKHIVRCYLRLSENLRAREALRLCLPDALRDDTFSTVLRQEESVLRWLNLLLKNISDSSSSAGGMTANSTKFSNPAVPSFNSIGTGSGIHVNQQWAQFKDLT